MEVDGGEEVKVSTPLIHNDKAMMMTEESLGMTSGLHVSEEEEAKIAIEMLRSDDLSARVTAANQLDSIAIALGEERTREELLPFLTDGADDEDEVLAAIATSLGKLVPHVGGEDYAYVILAPLEMLLAVEERSVREKAEKSAEVVSSALPSEFFHSNYAEMLARLATKEWFTARMSACGLIASGFTRLTPFQQESHVQHFSSLCRDEVPMVRRVAAQNLGKLLMNVVEVKGLHCVGQDGMLTTTFIPLYEDLGSSEQPDSVRLQTTENCIAFGKGMTSIQQYDGRDDLNVAAAEILVKRILPLIVSTIDDRSWRVRWTAASKFADVVYAFAKLEGAMDSLIPAYEKLLQDPEAEVRTASTLNLSKVAECDSTVLLPPITDKAEEGEQSIVDESRVTVGQRLVKRITALTEDDSENVRAALAMVAAELAPILGKDSTITDLVPPILLLLRDTTSEVRLNVISSLSTLNKVIGVDLLSQSLLPAILDLAEDGKWRIRLAIMHHIPLLAKQLGKDFFNEKLISLCVGWLGDDISSIRVAATSNLKELTKIFGAEWAIRYLIPPLNEICRNRSYLRRLTAVQAFSSIATVMEPDLAQTEILPIVLEMSTDNVANIRFNVAKGLETMAPVCTGVVSELQIRPVLAVLAEDPDRDVRFYAKKTLQSLENKSTSSKI